MNTEKRIEGFKKEIEKKMEQVVFERQEKNMLYADITWISRLYSYILSGNYESIRKYFQVNPSNIKGSMANDALRDMKNQTLFLLSIMLYKLKEDPFINSNIIPAILDSASILLETQIHLEEINNVAIACLFVISDEIQKAKRSDYHPLVRRIENYIFSHLHDKITVGEIAENLSMDPEYITSVFHRYTGRSIKQYIMDEKISRSKNLLLYSTYDVTQIASYLGFADSSHFGREFKKRLGMPPTAYRNLLSYK